MFFFCVEKKKKNRSISVPNFVPEHVTGLISDCFFVETHFLINAFFFKNKNQNDIHLGTAVGTES